MTLSATAAMLLALSDVAGEEPLAAATMRLAADLPAELGVISVDLPDKLREAGLKGKTLSIKWQRAPRVGTMSVKFITTAKDSKQVEYWGRVKLGERARVLVVAKALSQGASIAAGDLMFKTETVERGGGWRLAPAALVGARVLRDVTAGAQLTDDDVEAPPPIARGAAISVEIHKGRLRVATRGVLERATRPGEMTSIRLTATKKLVRARLVSASAAVVEESK